MREVLAKLDTAEDKVRVATLALELWSPGASLKQSAELALAMHREGSLRE